MVPPTHTLTLKFNSEVHYSGARGYQEGDFRVVDCRLRLAGLRGPVYCDILIWGSMDCGPLVARVTLVTNPEFRFQYASLICQSDYAT